MLKVVTPSREGQLREQLNFETLFSEISSRFVNIPSDKVDREIEDALRFICNALRVDESTIYLRDPVDPHSFVLSYVLRDPQLPPPPRTKFTAAEHFPWCNQKLIANEIVCLRDTQAAPPEAAVDKASWKRYGICSALMIPLSTGGRPHVGLWGLDSTTEQRDWPQAIQNRLKHLADVFANALERAERDRQLREDEARLRLAANTTGAGFWTIDLSTGAMWATPKLEELIGIDPNESMDVEGFLRLVHDEDRQRVREAIASMADGHEVTVDYRIVRSLESTRWVMSRGNLYKFDEAKPVLMGITLDITERRRNEETLRAVTSRLIDAQEEERKRIARELHDSIGQQIALISMQVQQLNSTRSADEREAGVEKVSAAVQSLSRSIQTISRELHTSSLDYLGLPAAIDGLCKQLRERHGLDIRFTASNVPKALPASVRLAAFRIVQEALHNVLKHSGQKCAEVRLHGAPGHIELTIVDEGAGFDVTKAMHGEGLGLVSMRERVFALKGHMAIGSRPGERTEIRVHLPINSAETSTPKPAE